MRPSMDQEPLVRQLVSEVIESGRTVEDVCQEHPELLNDVRRLWQLTRAVEEQIEAIFPSTETGDGAAAAPLDLGLPQIPGYDVQGIVGRGGMGVVYKARHLSLNRTVAVKMPLAGAFATAAERQRHMREARAVAALGHPNIITVHDVGEFEGRPYFTMEFIDGHHLGARLANTPQPAREAGALVATLAEATDRAHQAGIIHRDLKPSNVLLAPDGAPKITDFGLARHYGDDATLSMAGFQFGTPSYMSPEQASGQPAAQSPSVDIYSLGAILYEMLTGRPPFRAENAVETVRQVLEEEPAPPSRLNPRVPRDLETICLMCLRKEPQRRYATARALSEDLGRFLRGEPIWARPVGSVERVYRWGRRHPARALLIGAGACALVASLGVGFWVQHVQSARAGEAALREGRARQAIETAVSLVNDLRGKERWVEARHVLDGAYPYIAEANSAALGEDLHLADLYLTAAWELDDIRQRYPETSDTGFNYLPAFEAYAKIFTRLGFGEEVPLEAAARAVAGSPIREQLLVALDNAAFMSRAGRDRKGLERPLAIARAADPDPWRDRFRQSDAWYDRDTLITLCQEARFAEAPPPAHQVVIAGVLLGGLGARDKTIEILRDAHQRNPLDFWVNIELGNALTLSGRHEDASQYYRAAVTVQPANAGAWVSLAGGLSHGGSAEEAIIAARHATELNPHLFHAWRVSVDILRRAGRIDEAEEVLHQAIKENPDKRAALDGLRGSLGWNLARRIASRGEWPEALQQYKAVIPNPPHDAQFWFELAAVSLLAGDHRTYERTRDQMVERARPASLRVFLVARAVTLTTAPAEMARAAGALAEPEFLANPSVFWSVRQRGAILCRSGGDAEAIRLFEQGLATSPSKGRSVLNWLWLAIANHHLGRAEEAARWRDTAVEWLDALPKGMPSNATELGLHLHDWLEAQILRREVEALLSDKP